MEEHYMTAFVSRFGLSLRFDGCTLYFVDFGQKKCVSGNGYEHFR